MRKNILGYCALLTIGVMILTIVMIGIGINIQLPSEPDNSEEIPPYQDPRIYYGTPLWQKDNETTVFSAPETIIITNISYFLDGYIWRDFMPGQIKHSLIVTTFLIANESFPLTIDYDLLWVRKGTETYNATFYYGDRNEYSNKFVKGTYGGPEWAEGSRIDIAVRIIDENNNTYYLKSDNHTLVFTW